MAMSATPVELVTAMACVSARGAGPLFSVIVQLWQAADFVTKRRNGQAAEVYAWTQRGVLSFFVCGRRCAE